MGKIHWGRKYLEKKSKGWEVFGMRSHWIKKRFVLMGTILHGNLLGREIVGMGNHREDEKSWDGKVLGWKILGRGKCWSAKPSWAWQMMTGTGKAHGDGK